jgi:hypothetical protein
VRVIHRLVRLLDREGQCLVCVGNASPDSFHILPVDGKSLDPVSWDENNERIANTKLKNGELKSYYIYSARKACTCCGEPKPEERSDYDAELELNLNTAIKCVKGSGGDPACQ